MASFSDSDDDDDSLLTSGPTFSQNKKLRNKESRIEDRMMSFLDSCVSSSEHRQEQKRRMDELLLTNDNNNNNNQNNSGGSGDNKRQRLTKQSPSAENSDNDDSTPSSTPPHHNETRSQYWERMEIAAKGDNSEEKLKRKRQLNDAVDGVDLNYSQLSQDDYGDDDGRTKRVGRATAKATGASSDLGLRQIFFPSENNDDTTNDRLPESLSSVTDAIDDILSTISMELKRQPKSPRSPRGQSRRKMLTSLKRACKISGMAVAVFLQRGALSKVCRDVNRGDNVVSKDVKMWLWSVACSGESVGMPLCKSAAQTLREIVMSSVDDGKEVMTSASVGNFFYVGDLVVGLEVLFGFVGDDAQLEKLRDDVENNTKAARNGGVSVLGLVNYLSIWTIVIQHDIANWTNHDNDGNPISTLETISTCIAALVRCSLDPIFHKGDKDPLLCLQQLILVLFQTAHRELSLPLNNKSKNTQQRRRGDQHSWMKHTAERIIRATCQLSTGPSGSADEDDVDGRLPLALAVRNLPDNRGAKSQKSDAVMLFVLMMKALTVKEALCYYPPLRELLDDKDMTMALMKKFRSSVSLPIVSPNRKKQGDDHDQQQPSSTGAAFGENVSAWQPTLAVAELILSHVEKNMSHFTTDGPLFYATIELATISALTGTELYMTTISSSSSPPSVAALCSLHLSSLEQKCIAAKKNVTSVFVQPHLRRVKEFLTWLSVHYRHLSDDITRNAKNNRKKKISRSEGTLTSWVTGTGGSMNR